MSKICFIELHNVYFLSNILTLIKSTNLKWTGHIARMEVMSDAKILTDNVTGKNLQEDLGGDGRIILEMILKKQMG